MTKSAKKKRKKYEELTIVDDFMFGKVMRSPQHCRKLLEVVLGQKIKKIQFLEDQRTLNPDYHARGIRMDVYVEDQADTVYAVEMQLRDTGELPERSRYYQSVIDINMIEKSVEYKHLKKSYVIFICKADLFGRGRHIYHFENLCREDPSIRLEDGTEKIFLNTKGTMDDVGEELRNLLNYFESLRPQDAFTEALEEAVEAARQHREWRREYMKLELMLWDSRDEGRKEGLTVGRAEGRAEGLATGRSEGLASSKISFVCRKLSKGKSPETIAQEWGEDPDEVRRICDIAAKYAPEYDIEKILWDFLPDL